MLNLKTFIQGIYSFVKGISKKAYRTCAIIASGITVIAVVSLSSNNFGGSGKNDITKNTVAGNEETKEQIGQTEDLAEMSVSVLPVSNTEKYLSFEGQLDNSTEKTITIENIETTETIETNVINLNEEELEALMRIVEAEAGNQDIIGRMLVANVIINRVNNSYFPNTILEVIFQNDGNVYQFEPIKNGYYYSVTISELTKEAVEKVLKGEDYSMGALYFTRSSSKDSWFNTSLTKLFMHGAHYFYK